MHLRRMLAIPVATALAVALTAGAATRLGDAPMAMGSGTVTMVSSAATWSWPVDGPRGVLRAFVLPPEPWLPGHRGIDIAAHGLELLAPADGIVRFAGRVVDRGVLSIDHGGAVVSSFEPVVALVAEGEAVARGQVVARIDGGHCPVACVHVGLRIDGAYRNPLLLLGGASWPILLPTRPLSGGV
ncbi:MAG TPA: peptidoglycan DD-metalloendopeptidase family protein [Microbacteriaceae bacterium]|nr:peptidoglycan DD-metalloendopeptidase family protein [Microbacteriaceae bacterium]